LSEKVKPKVTDAEVSAVTDAALNALADKIIRKRRKRLEKVKPKTEITIGGVEYEFECTRRIYGGPEGRIVVQLRRRTE